MFQSNGSNGMLKNLSVNFFDLALRSNAIRNIALKKGREHLYDYFVIKNKDEIPCKIQEMRYRALTNLLHSVNKALSDGRIASRVRKEVIKEFIGNVVTGESKRQQPFRAKYGFNPPSFLTISPTKKCNLACKGCYAASSAKNDNTIDYQIFQKILDEKKREWGSHFTVISGGEPLMYRSSGKDIYDIFRENQDNYFMMYTNSTLIDRDAAKKLADTGNVTPAISVEGWEEQTDARRGKGVFRKIQQAMDNLAAEGVPFGISVTATRENAEVVVSDEFMDYYYNQKGAIYGWIFQYMPIGRSFTVDLMVTPEQRQRMLEKQIDLIYNKKLFIIDFWNGGPMSVGCISAGRPGGYFYIDWDGNIAPCVFFPYHLGNIYDLYQQDQNLTDILMSDYFKSIRTWQESYSNRKNGGKCNGHKMNNMFTPCPMRDHYKFAHETITRFSAQPMDGDAARALKDPKYKEKLIAYDQKIKKLLDPLWEKEIYSS